MSSTYTLPVYQPTTRGIVTTDRACVGLFAEPAAAVIHQFLTDGDGNLYPGSVTFVDKDKGAHWFFVKRPTLGDRFVSVKQSTVTDGVHEARFQGWAICDILYPEAQAPEGASTPEPELEAVAV